MVRFRALAAALPVWAACITEIVDEEPAPGPKLPDYVAADGVTITQVAIYQGVERILMKGGAAGQGVPVIAGRDALVRAFYTTDGGYDGNPVLARLTVGDGAPIERALTLGKASKQDALGSTLDFQVPGASITGAAGFRVEVLRAPTQSSGKNKLAMHPAEGKQTLGAITAPKLKLVLVPIRYKADGSNRLPDTSEGQLKMYRDAFWRVYPVAEVDVRVVNPLDFGTAIQANGAGWDVLLDAVTKHRASSGAADDEHYYGIFAPAESFEKFCAPACIAGLSHIVLNPFQAWSRAGIGLGFSGERAGDTAVHEIGHEHGRAHAPCKAPSGIDQGYPYQGGDTGGWGYDFKAKALVSPTTKDFMSYCDPKWVSDYTYGALLSRLQAISGGKLFVGELEAPPRERKSYERVVVQPDGRLRWLEPLVVDVPPIGAPERVRVETAEGAVDLPGHFFPFSHLSGGTILFPATPARAHRVTARNASASR